MDRNLILAIALSIVIVIVFQVYFQVVAPPPEKRPQQTKEVTRPATKPGDKTRDLSQKEAARKSADLSKPEDEKVKTDPAPAGDVKEALVTVDGPMFKATLSSRGARIVSFQLKKYTQKLGSPQLVNLFSAKGPDSSGPSITLVRQDEIFNDASLMYSPSSGAANVTLQEDGADKSVEFVATTPAGITIRKKYTFYPEKYSVGFAYSLTNTSKEDRDYRVTLPWKKVYRKEQEEDRFAWNSAEILLNGALKDYSFKDIKGDEEIVGKIKWAGLGDVYFFKAIVLGDRSAEKVTLFKPTADRIVEIGIRLGGISLPPGKAVANNLSLYLGPKEHHALVAAGHDLRRSLVYSHYFILEVMSEYLMKFLRLSHSGFTVLGIKVPGIGNWGWDIIILTILIKILFIPLTHKSMKSMKRMQDLQPEIEKIKEKHAGDKAALNQATMQLFKEHKVNPLGGCWPMFLQLPVFIALYQTLSYAIELRHASFVCIPSIYLCLNDLSAPDPYYVTPILMGGTMVLQQWLTPSAGDPTQRKMMLLMPVFFTYIFLTFPSGLVLYWLVSNLLSIGQQLITNRLAK